MNYADLAAYQIDCSRKAQQITFLESQRSSPDDRLWAWTTNYFMPWQQFTEPDRYRDRRAVTGGNKNWMINQKLLRLGTECP